MTINYITYDSWWDTDVTVIPPLSKGFKMNVFCLDPYEDKKYPNKYVPDGVNLNLIIQKYRDRDFRSLGVAIHFVFKCLKAIRNKDSINFFIPGKNPWLLLLMLLFLPKKRTIISSHNYVEHGDRKNIGASITDKVKIKFYQNFNYFHFFSQYQRNLFQKDYSNKVSFVTEMPIKNYGKPIAKPRIDSNIHLLFFGLVRDYKRLDWLIDAVNAVCSDNIKVTIAGNASKDDIAKYTKLINNNKCFEMHFGFVANEDIPHYFADADFLVLPYESATQSGPSLIAINYGIPVIASDVTAFKSLINDNENGFLFHKDSLEDFTKLIKKVSTLSRPQIDEMKRNQLKFKESYNKSNDILSSFSVFIKSSGFK